MELKDVILSTLAEMEDTSSLNKIESDVEENPKVVTSSKEEEKKPLQKPTISEKSSQTTDNELLYLTSIRERLLVLFEGFQAPNNTNLEAKVDMTLNFLEYTLSTIDTRVEMINKRNSSESI